MKLLKKSTMVILGALVCALAFSLVFFHFLFRGVQEVSAANLTYNMTGGRVLYNMNSGTDNAKYNSLGYTEFDNYIQRAKFSITSSGTVNRANAQTLYTNSGTFTIKFNFYHVNTGIDKSWIKTDSHYLYLCEFGNTEFNITNDTSVSGALNAAQTKQRKPAMSSGESIKDADCYLSRTYTNLPNGRYTLWARFHQGHGVASSQFNNYFAYAQDIIVDTRAPSITVDAANNASKTSVKATWSATSKEAPISGTYILNGVNKGTYTSGTALTAEGKYTVRAEDYAGNISSVTMYVDKTPPALSGVNGKTSAYVEIDKNLLYASPVTATYTYNDVDQGAYYSGQTLTRAGKYVINATDRAGNTAETTVYVDNTPPILSASLPSKTSVKATWTKSDFEAPVSATYTHNGVLQGVYTSGQTLSNEGRYVITATDVCGNRASVTLYADQTAPTLTCSANYTKDTAMVRWSSPGTNESAIAGATYTRTYYDEYTQSAVTSDPATYLSGQTLSNEGKYTVTVEDAAGNSASATLTVDRTAPKVTASNPSRSFVSASWKVAAYEAPVSASYTYNGGASQAYSSGTFLTTEGKYIVTVFDAADNVTVVTMFVDKTAPILSNSAPSKTSVSASWTVGEYESAVSSTYTYNGIAKGKYSSGLSLAFEGKYVITAIDAAGNSASVTLYVDRTAPVLTGSAPSKTAARATWSVGAYESAVSASYTRNGVAQGEYSSGKSLSAEGMYIITATDAAGNSASITIYIDKTAPTLFGSAPSKTSAFATWIVGTFETAVTATYTLTTLSGTTATKTYFSGDILSSEGKYVITVTDVAGNFSSVTLYVDRTAPVLTGSAPSKTNGKATWSVGAYETSVLATYTRNGVAQGEYTSGQSLNAEGMYIITATDVTGNSASVTLYVDKTAPVLTRSDEYEKNGCSATWAVGLFESAITATYTITTAVETSTPKSYVSGMSLTSEGKYIVTATDAAGNSSFVVFTVDRTAPALNLSAQITRDSASASWTVLGFEAPVSVTYSWDGVLLGAYVSGQVISIEGEYLFTATDTAGNVTTATIMVDKTAPTLTFTAGGKLFTGYTRDTFIAAGKDNLSGVDALELFDNGKWIAYDYTPREVNGAYLFRLSDHAGNVTTDTVTVYRTDTFGNLSSIRDGYKLNSWYIVTLPARIFTTSGKDIAGRYSFECYDAALNFAFACEREFRVTPVQGGYMYVSVTNETVSQKYTDEETLTDAVNKYAAEYISARQTASEAGSDKYYNEPESMTRNSPPPSYRIFCWTINRFHATSSAAPMSLDSRKYLLSAKCLIRCRQNT